VRIGLSSHNANLRKK